MSGQRLRYGLLHNHHRLVRQLELGSLLPSLISEGLITQQDKELIKSQKTSSDSVEKLLSLLHRRGNTDSGIFQRFLDILSDPDVTAGQHLGDLVGRIRNDSESEDVASKFSYGEEVLVEGHNATLKEHEQTIVTSLNVGDVLPQLVARGVVSTQENDDIRQRGTANDQAYQLLRVIQRRGSKAYTKFVGVLSESETTKQLGKILEEGSGAHLSDKKYVEEMLKRGHVPPRLKVYVERNELIQNIRTELRRLKDGDRWVVVHGMAGFGKTVLAAEAIRDAELLREVFPGGVHWLTVGQMVDKDGDVDTARLLNKLQTIILRLDEKKTYKPPSVEAATDFLQEVISKQHPQSLLILDDVWSSEVAQAFSARCRVMVTTRNANVAERVDAQEVFSVSVSEGLSEDCSKELLAKWLKVDPSELPPQADTIVTYCWGSPMAIGLIGPLLKRSPSEERWREIAKAMEETGMVLTRKLSAAENYTTLKHSIELSVKTLPDYLTSYFEMFVVLDYDTLVTREALQTIWDTGKMDTEDYMKELIDYSLARQASAGKEDHQTFTYQLHDIVLDYLRNTISKSKQMELHGLVVTRYGDRCNGHYPKLEDDHYVYTKLLSHLVSAGNYELLGDLMTQLRWLMSVVQFGDANTYLAEYRHYKEIIPQQFKTGAKQFELFLSGHMYVLANSPTVDDVVQLALLIADTSEVYKQAIAMTTATIGRKKSWFNWSNKWSDPEKYSLKLKLHHDGVQMCRFSLDETKVLSCASNEVKLWDSTTGMVLADYKGHRDRVTCCDMSKAIKYVVSSSEDTTVKLWDAHKKTVIHDFTGHKYGVQCCAFSPDDTLVLSADVDSVVMLWSVRDGKVKSQWRIGALSPAVTPVEGAGRDYFSVPMRSISDGGGEGVEACAFSPGGLGVVTTSQNGSVRLWDLGGGLKGTFVGHTASVRACVFSKDGDLLATASDDRTARVWNVPTLECDVKLANEDAAVLSCDFSPDASQLLTGDTEGAVKVWGLPSGRLLQVFPAHWDWVNCVLYSPHSRYMLSAADSGLIKIMWMTEEEEASLKDVQNVNKPVYHRRFSVYFRPVGRDYQPIIVAYATLPKKLQILSGVNGEVVIDELAVPARHTPRCWVISSNGELVAVGYEEGMIQVFSVREGPGGQWTARELWRKPNCHNMQIVKIYFSPKSNKIVTCSNKHHRVWLATEGQELSSCGGRGLGVRPCEFFSDNVRAASAVEGGVLVWNTNTGSEVRRLTSDKIIAHEANILCVAVSSDDSRLAASVSTGIVVVWEVASGRSLLASELLPYSPCARSCALSPDGSLVAAGFDDGSMRIWDNRTGRIVNTCLTGSEFWMIDIAFSPDGGTITTLCDSIQWWRADGTHVKRFMFKGGAFGKYIRFSPDFMNFVTIDNVGILYILTTRTQT